MTSVFWYGKQILVQIPINKKKNLKMHIKMMMMELMILKIMLRAKLKKINMEEPQLRTLETNNKTMIWEVTFSKWSKLMVVMNFWL